MSSIVKTIKLEDSCSVKELIKTQVDFFVFNKTMIFYYNSHTMENIRKAFMNLKHIIRRNLKQDKSSVVYIKFQIVSQKDY